jgi:hypothetical protein
MCPIPTKEFTMKFRKIVYIGLGGSIYDVDCEVTHVDSTEVPLDILEVLMDVEIYHDEETNTTWSIDASYYA